MLSKRVSLFLGLTAMIGSTAAAQNSAQSPPPLLPRGITVRTVTDTIPGGVGGVAADRGGAIYSADFRNNVWMIQPDGRRSLHSTGFYGASGNNVDARGRLIQSNFFGNYVARVSRTGDISIIAEGLNGPVGVALDPAQNIYVTNCSGNTISRISTDGELTEFASGPLFNCPNGITVAPDSTVYVVNFSDGRVIAIDSDGNPSVLAVIPGPGNGHVAIARGDLYVTAFQSHRIFRVSMQGNVQLIAGTGQPGEVDGPAASSRFTFPNGIAVGPGGDRLYVNDFINRFPPTLEVPPAPHSTIRQITLPPFSDMLLAAILSGERDSLEAVHDRWKANPATANVFTERDVNALGYRLMGAGRIQDAITIFELNVADYPNSFNTHDSLGEAYKNAGRNADAIASYERSLALNPGNTNATQMLQELRDQ